MGADSEWAESGSGGAASRRKIEAQASMMQGSGVKLRRKDPERRRRGLERRRTRKLLRGRRLVMLVGSLVVLLVSGFFIYRQLAEPRGAGLSTVAVKMAGRFVCESCGKDWEGEAMPSHPFDPYVRCKFCRAVKARRAVQCPSCNAWVLEPMLHPSKPFREMNWGEYRRWQLANRSSLARARCSKCGEPLYPPRAAASRP